MPYRVQVCVWGGGGGGGAYCVCLFQLMHTCQLILIFVYADSVLVQL